MKHHHIHCEEGDSATVSFKDAKGDVRTYSIDSTGTIRWELTW